MSRYADDFGEIRIDYFDENTGLWSVDAWRTDDPNEEGTVVAYIDPETREVFYTNPDYRYDGFINTEIQSFLEEL